MEKIQNQLLVFLCALVFVCLANLVQAEELFIEPENPVAPKLHEIRFVGNETTKPEIMLQEMLIAVGDPVNARLIEKSRQLIMNLKLFKTVKAVLLEEGHWNTLVITVEEKYYLLPLPRVNRNTDGDIKAGGELRWDNIFGMNQSLKVSWDRTRSADSDIDDSDKSEIDYTYPRMFGTPFTFEIDTKFKQTNVEEIASTGEAAEAEQRNSFARFSLSRWHNSKGPSIGLRYGAGLASSVTKHKTRRGPDEHFVNSRLVTLEVGAAVVEVYDREFSRTGHEYGYDISVGLRGIGSEQGHSTHSLFYRRYYHVFGMPHHNLNSQVRFGFSNFRDNALSIGGANSLRGYSRGEFAGNALLLLNLEYLMPVWGYKPFRFLVFTDIGNTYPSLSEMNLREQKFSFGAGLRWKLRSFVKTDLRVDVAYVPDTDESRIYASTNETF